MNVLKAIEMLDKLNKQRYKTYVANAYTKEIYATVTSEKGEVSLEKIIKGIEEEDKIELFCRFQGFETIFPDFCCCFNVAGEGLFELNVYVSVVSGEKVIADKFQLRNDTSVIIDAQGCIQIAKYGEVWIDTSSKNYQ